MRLLKKSKYQIAGHFYFEGFVQHSDWPCRALAAGLDTAVTSFCRFESPLNFFLFFGFGIWV